MILSSASASATDVAALKKFLLIQIPVTTFITFLCEFRMKKVWENNYSEVTLPEYLLRFVEENGLL